MGGLEKREGGREGFRVNRKGVRCQDKIWCGLRLIMAHKHLHIPVFSKSGVEQSPLAVRAEPAT